MGIPVARKPLKTFVGCVGPALAVSVSEPFQPPLALEPSATIRLSTAQQYRLTFRLEPDGM
jgi:hypothetical protein